MIETYTYPDGSQRVGCPPFPRLSPLEQAQGKPEPVAEVVAVEVPAEPEKRKPGRPKKAD